MHRSDGSKRRSDPSEFQRFGLKRGDEGLEGGREFVERGEIRLPAIEKTYPRKARHPLSNTQH